MPFKFVVDVHILSVKMEVCARRHFQDVRVF